MSNWKHKLKIKHHFMDHDLNTVEQVMEASGKIAEDLNSFMDTLDEDSLFYSLEDVLILFEELTEDFWKNETYDEIEKAFDYAMKNLYDVADFEKQIWVE